MRTPQHGRFVFRSLGMMLGPVLLFAAAVAGSCQEALGTASADELYRELAAELSAAARAVATAGAGALSGEEMASLAALDRRIRDSPYGDLVERSALLLLLTGEQQHGQSR